MANQRSIKPKDQTRVELYGEVHFLQLAWDSLVKKHTAWAEKFPDDDAVYSLPKSVIESMALPCGHKVGPVLTESDAAAERAFTAFCEKLRYVGMLNGSGILY